MTSPSASDVLERLSTSASVCTACALSETRHRVVFGSGDPNARFVMVGEAPGRDEDLGGEPFVGRSGVLLFRLVGEALRLERRDIYLLNTVKCRPPDNRTPRRTEIDSCRPFLAAQLSALHPAVIVTLGNVATHAVTGNSDGMTSAHGKVLASTLCDAPIIPTFHPAAGLRGGTSVVDAIRADLTVAGAILEAAS